MKKHIFLAFLGHLRSKPHLKRKLKALAMIGVVGFILTSALVIWAGASVVRLANSQIQGVNMHGPVEKLEERLSSLPAIATASCWGKAQSLMNLESWATRPVADNFKNLKTACLEQKVSR